MLLHKPIRLSTKMLISLLLIASVMLVACSKKEQAPISFWHSMADKQAVAINEMAQAFAQLHPDITVRPIYQGSYDQLHQKLIAAITSCTNTSNPMVLLAAGLLAKNAVAKGLSVPKYIKTSLAPGSRVVTDYLRDADCLSTDAR